MELMLASTLVLTLRQVDVLVSEPMGTLLVNERMLETYLYARDHYLKPGAVNSCKLPCFTPHQR